MQCVLHVIILIGGVILICKQFSNLHCTVCHFIHHHSYRDGYESTGSGDGERLGEKSVKEFDDHIEINGISIHKPFVEKPVDADDHNIAIYYPTSAGGGCKKLFRKIGNRSSEFYPDIHEVRRDGSYIYEEFVETQGTDVKVSLYRLVCWH